MSNFFLRPVPTLAFLQLLAFYETSAPAADAPKFPTDIRVETGVSFLGDARKEQADLYFPAEMAKDARLPAVLIIHGGGWVGGKRDAAREINVGSTLARNGYIGMSIDYKLSLGGRAPRCHGRPHHPVRWPRPREPLRRNLVPSEMLRRSLRHFRRRRSSRRPDAWQNGRRSTG